MSRKVGLLAWIILTLLCLAFFIVSSGYGLERKQPLSIPPHAAFHPPFSPEGEPWFCTIQYDTASVAWYFHEFGAGDGIAVYMDPQFCGFDSTYPFKITNVHFYLRGPEVFVWPVEIKVNIVSVDTTEDTLNPGMIRPGSVIHYKTFTIPEDSAYNPADPRDPINLYLDTNFCVTAPFFLEIVYTGMTEPLYPGLVMTDVTDLPDTNDNWVYWKGNYVEWHDFWENPIPGRAIFRVTGYPYAIDCDICWDWVSKTIKAPSGMPDFDQYQFGSDSAAICAPTAVANCLVWLGAIPSIPDPDSLIRLLSFYFHTDPSTAGGTLVDSVKAGLDSLFADYGLDLYSIQLENPTFSEVADSMAKPASVILLVGLWQNIGATWHRIGGHYVSAAGACESNLWMGVSDPAVDNAESGARGRVLPTHDPHPDDDTLHNAAGFVSHDAYVSDTLSVGPYVGAWILRDLQGEDLPWISGFDGLNFQPDQDYHAYDPVESLYAVVEYAVMILEKPTLVTEDEEILPTRFELRQSYPNPFNNQTMIKYSLFKRTEVSLIIYNILGQKVRTLVNNERQSGDVLVTWDGKDESGKDLSSGIYFYQLRAKQFTQTRRMVLLK